jgi:hypothetical protein
MKTRGDTKEESKPLPYSYFDLSDEELSLVQSWEQLLPPVIARKHVEWFTGGALKRQRLSAADSEGTGPLDPLRVGRCVCYWTRHLLVWMVKSRGVSQMETFSKTTQERGLQRDVLHEENVNIPF